ncbi:hypothetical protein HMPREF0797_0307 [Staphylococcus epidermidis SK135]|nr:hypothetical protein HMPREF0797_0307 [Staphylococcus epidermidis SK135]
MLRRKKQSFTEETKDFNQQPEKEQPIEVQHKDIPEEKENENLNEEPSTIDDKQFEEIDNEYEDKEENHLKKVSGVGCLVINTIKSATSS